MGFCLFQHAEPDGMYFAVNCAHVEDIIELSTAEGPCALLQLGTALKFRPLARGTREDVQKMLGRGTRIGLNKLEIDILGGRDKLKASPLLLNQPDRVILVRELAPDEFISRAVGCMTAGEIFMEDGSTRLIAQRPGIFAYRANARHNVPVLTVN